MPTGSQNVPSDFYVDYEIEYQCNFSSSIRIIHLITCISLSASKQYGLQWGLWGDNIQG